jgi:hypothetical protein
MSIIEQLKKAFDNLGSNFGDAFEPKYQLEESVKPEVEKPADKKPDVSDNTEELRKIVKQLNKISKRLEKLMADQK